MSSDPKLSVFVSSTSEDLKEHRAVARLAILDLDWMPVMMEHFTALPDPTVAACLKKLSGCELMILLVGFRRGWVPTAGQGGDGIDSITAHELAFARKNNIQVLAFRANDDTWPGSLWEKEQAAREWVDRFRANLNLTAPLFDPEKEAGLPLFRGKLVQSLLSYKESLPVKSRAANGTAIDYFESAQQGIAEGEVIPFVGHEVYGEGALSTRSLVHALGADAFGEQSCLATVAECQEQRKKKRHLFLKQFREEIRRQSSLVTRTPDVYHMLLGVKPPPLIVSATWDFEFEHMLEQQGRSYALVSHVLRSLDTSNEGKILVSSGGKTSLFPADQVDLPGVDYVIYKLLGSPLYADADIDTVVVTETDHALLLGRLENKATGVPTRFSRLLQLGLVLFLGYGLDSWPYRLVMRIFHSIGGDLASSAVRDRVSLVEEAAWKKLGTDLIDMEIGAFAQRLEESLRNGSGHSAYAG